MKHTKHSHAVCSLAIAIKRAREAANLKQNTAAKLLYISRTTLSGYENEKIHLLPASVLLQMSKVYAYSFSSFFEYLPPPDAPVRLSPLIY